MRRRLTNLRPPPSGDTVNSVCTRRSDCRLSNMGFMPHSGSGTGGHRASNTRRSHSLTITRCRFTKWGDHVRGRKNARTLDELFELYVEPIPEAGCWLWMGSQDRGYGLIRRNRHHKQIRAHRASYERTYGPIRNSVLVLHKCDTPGCVNPNHLFLGTQQDNMTDKTLKGRSQSKLSPDDIRNIRRDTRTIRAIAEAYSVTRPCIGSIKSGKTWRWVT